MDCQVQVRNCPCLTIHAFVDTKFHDKQVKGIFLGPREGYEWITATLSLDYSIRHQTEFCVTLKNTNSTLSRLYHLQYNIILLLTKLVQYNKLHITKAHLSLISLFILHIKSHIKVCQKTHRAID